LGIREEKFTTREDVYGNKILTIDDRRFFA
jgi:hypothetical protein